MITLPRSRPARRTGGGGAIPRVIHQTFETATVPPGMARAADTWSALNPGFVWQFHDAVDRRTFIERHYGGDVARAYAQLSNGAFQADLWRYCLLHEQGGVYADIDMVCLADLESLLSPEDRFVAAPDGYKPWALSNGFLCVAPKHPVMAAAIARATAQILRMPRKFNGWQITGPGNLGLAANQALGRPAETPFVGGSCVGDLRLLERANGSATMRRHFHSNGKPVLLTEYPDYREDLGSAGLAHWSVTIPQHSPLRRLVRALLGQRAA
ncbi:MAG: glycosyltransferase [Pseudomonadota bacterium]